MLKSNRPRRSAEDKIVLNVMAPPRRSELLDGTSAATNSIADIVDRRHSRQPFLNDDCLRTIFSFVAIRDLLKIRECSRRLRALADEVIPKQCRNVEFHYDADNTTDRVILKNYGQFMRSVIVEAASGRIAKCREPLEHCTALKTLTMRNFLLDYDGLDSKFFENVEHLIFDQCMPSNDLNKFDTIIKACTNLKTIRMIRVRGSYSYFASVIERAIDGIGTLESFENLTIRKLEIAPWSFDIRCTLAKLRNLKKLKCLQIDLRCSLSEVQFISVALNGLSHMRRCQMNLECLNGSLDQKEFRESLTDFDITIKHEKMGDYPTCNLYNISIERKN